MDTIKAKAPLPRSLSFPSEVLARNLGAAFGNWSELGRLARDGNLAPGALTALPGPLYLLANPFVYGIFPLGGVAPLPIVPVPGAPPAIAPPFVRFFPGATLYDHFSQDEDENEFTKRLEDNWARVCNPAVGAVNLAFGDLSPVKIYVLNSQLDFRQDPSRRSLKGVGGLPGARDELSTLAVASGAGHNPMASGFFRHPTGNSYAHSQAQVYNPVSHDLYTQAWSARLTRSRFLDDPNKLRDIAESLRSEAGFESLGRFFHQLRTVSRKDLERINLH